MYASIPFSASSFISPHSCYLAPWSQLSTWVCQRVYSLLAWASASRSTGSFLGLLLRGLPLALGGVLPSYGVTSPPFWPLALGVEGLVCVGWDC